MKWKRKWEMGNGKENQLFQRIEPHKRCLTHNVCECAIWTPFHRSPSPFRVSLALWLPHAKPAASPLLLSGGHVNRMRPCTSCSHNNKSQQQPTVACNSACVCVSVSVCYLWETRFHFPLNVMREGEPKPDPGPVRLASEPELEPQPKPWPFPPLHAHSPPPLSERAQMEPEVEHTAADAVKQKQVAAGPH